MQFEYPMLHRNREHRFQFTSQSRCNSIASLMPAMSAVAHPFPDEIVSGDRFRTISSTAVFYLFEILRFLSIPLAELSNLLALHRYNCGQHVKVVFQSRIPIKGYTHNTQLYRSTRPCSHDFLKLDKEI